jgi:glutamate-1-semialdehyde aminotransferase
MNISNYDDVLSADLDKKAMFFLGMLNEGVLLQTGIAGSLNILSTEADIDRIVNAARKVAQRSR